MAEHCVKIIIPLSDGGFGTDAERSRLSDSGDEVASHIAEAGGGEFDGDEFGEGICTFYLYGPDADDLYASVENFVKATDLCKGATIYKRYGEADDEAAKEVEFQV